MHGDTMLLSTYRCALLPAGVLYWTADQQHTSMQHAGLAASCNVCFWNALEVPCMRLCIWTPDVYAVYLLLLLVHGPATMHVQWTIHMIGHDGTWLSCNRWKYLRWYRKCKRILTIPLSSYSWLFL